VQICVVWLWRYRDKYFDSTKGKYETGAYDVCKQAVIRATRGKQRNFERGFLSLDMPVDNENETLTFHDLTAKTESEQSAEIVTDEYHEINNEILKRKEYQNTKAKEILQYFFEGYTEYEIKSKVGCCRSYIQKVKKNYKTLFAKISKEYGDDII
jgi:hypothetical protein